MNLTFDIRGNLMPYEKIQMTPTEFKERFVETYQGSSTRQTIFSNYESYIKAFSEQVSSNFLHWIDGSFVTKKLNPRDIDFVSLIDHDIATRSYSLLKDHFLNKESLKKYRLDAYLIRMYPADHKEYSKTASDLLYWSNWFGKTKRNRAKRRFPKGFIEISYSL